MLIIAAFRQQQAEQPAEPGRLRRELRALGGKSVVEPAVEPVAEVKGKLSALVQNHSN